MITKITMLRITIKIIITIKYLKHANLCYNFYMCQKNINTSKTVKNRKTWYTTTENYNKIDL